MLDVRRLEMLRDLADHGTITAVADLHRITASAVSQQLRQLEQETGSDLLERTGRAVRLTAAGRLLAERAEPVLAALEEAQAALDRLGRSVAGQLHVSCFTSALGPLAAPLTRTVAERYPLLEVHLLEAEPEAGLAELRQRRTDLAVTYRYPQLGTRTPAGVTVLPLLRDPLVLAVPSGRAVRDLAEVADEPWIAAREGTGCREATLHACRSAGFTPGIRHSCGDFPSTLDLVAAGAGVAVLPRLATLRPPPGVAFLPLADPAAARVVEAAVRTGSADRPSIAACLTVLTDTAALLKEQPCA